MVIGFLLALSVLFHLLSVLVAIYLIRITNGRRGWVLMSMGMIVVSIRRIMMVLNRFIQSPFLSSPYLTPVAALFLSLFIFLGLLMIIPILRSIKSSELRYRSIFDTSGVSLWEEDLCELYKGFENVKNKGITDFRTYLNIHPEFVDKAIKSIMILDVNQATLDLFKYNNKKILISSLGSTFSEKSREVFIEYLISIYNGENVFESETEYLDAEGNKFNAVLKIISPKDKNQGKHSIVSITDITARYRTEKKLLTVLDEKNTLLKELYHRTKNNMQVIIAMLNLRSYSIDSEIVSTAFNDMIRRIESMSLVHEKLYKSENLSVIKLDDYIDELISLLISTDSMWDPKIQIILDLDSILVDIDRAIPCGLIINELLSNIYKHAFKGMDSGEIKISLHNLEADKVEIIVADDGVGLPSVFDIKKCETLGLQTVIALGEDQLHGSVDITSLPGEKGSKWRLVFTNTHGESRI